MSACLWINFHSLSSRRNISVIRKFIGWISLLPCICTNAPSGSLGILNPAFLNASEATAKFFLYSFYSHGCTRAYTKKRKIPGLSCNRNERATQNSERPDLVFISFTVNTATQEAPGLQIAFLLMPLRHQTGTP